MRARGFCWPLDFLEPHILVGVLRPPPLLTSKAYVCTPASSLMLSTLLNPLQLKGLIALAVVFACGFGGMLASPIWLAVATILLSCDAWPRRQLVDSWVLP